MKKLFLLLLVLCIFAPESHARAGGGRSFGSRGSRGVSPRTSRAPYSQPFTQPGFGNRTAPSSPGYQAPPSSFGGGGFMRNMAAGLAGGFLGSMLFRNSSWAGNGLGGGGGGFGFLEILLLAGVAFLAFRWFRRSRSHAATSQPFGAAPFQPSVLPPLPTAAPSDDIASVVGMDLTPFKEARVDDFFKLQAAIMNRELAHVRGTLTAEMAAILENDISVLKSKGQINRIESIAVRESEIIEAWQEADQDFATLHLKASLLDFTVDEKTGAVVGGDKNTPVKFDEYWTFARPHGSYAGSDAWKLTAIENNA